MKCTSTIISNLGRLRLVLAVVAAALLAPLAFAAPPAGGKTALPIEQGFPFDCIAYGEMDLKGGLAAWTDQDAFVKAGAIWMGFDDLVEQLSGPFKWGEERPISGNDLRLVLRGIKKLAGAIIDVTADGPSWLIAIEHDDPAAVIDIMKASAHAKAVMFEQRGDHDGTPIYTVQAPESWLPEMARRFTNMRRGFWWGGAQPDRYTDPLMITEWGGKYLLISSREADLLDAVDNYEKTDELELTLVGSRSFAIARRESAGQDIMLWWNLDSFIKKLERITGAAGPGMKEYVDLIEAVAEVKQFRALTFNAKYDAASGWMSASAKLSFHNPPTWLSVLPFDAKPAPLTNFCPQRPAMYVGAGMDSPSKVYREALAIVKQKCEAVGRPKEWERIAKGLEEFTKLNGYSVDEAVAQVGSEHAAFWLNPYVPPGESRRGDGAAVIIRVLDMEKAKEFLQQRILLSPGMRDAFHVNQRAFMDIEVKGAAEKQRIGYWVFNADDESSFSYLFLDGCLIMGTQDAVRASIAARMGGVSLATDGRFIEVDAKLPKGGLLSFYADLGYLAENAEAIFPQGSPESDGWSDPFGGMVFIGEDEMGGAPAPVEPDAPDELTLAAKLMKNHMPELRIGARLVVTARSIEVAAVALGLPNTAGIASMWATVAKHQNWRESRDALRDRLAPAVMAQLFERGDLPVDPADFAKKGGDISVFRDPNLAGPAASKPSAEQTFVWLGNHAGRDLVPAVPLAHTRNPGEGGLYILLMSDGSVHRAAKPALDAALKAAADPNAEPPFHSKHPQTLKALMTRMIDNEKGSSNGPEFGREGSRD